MDQNGEKNGQSVPPKVDLRKQVTQPPQSPPGPGRNLETMHIELQDDAPAAAAVPPSSKPVFASPRPTVSVKPPIQIQPNASKATVVVKPMPASPTSSERMQTMEINPDDVVPAASAPAQTRAPSPSPTVSVKPIGLPSVPGAPAAKRETSRIPLEMAKPPLGAPGRPPAGPSTIRVKPVVVRQTVDLAQAVPDAAASAAAPVPAPVSPESGKRKTSRISLESVLTQSASASQTAEITPPEVDDEPRTIRIKRSVERPTVQQPPASAAISPGQTARLELPPDTPAPAPGTAPTQTPTRKKTIKMRRPGEEGGEEPASAASSAVARPEPVVQKTDDVPHVTFGVLAVVTVFVMAVLLWVLMAQAFGPNISLTQLSYGWPESPFAWFGQITR